MVQLSVYSLWTLVDCSLSFWLRFLVILHVFANNGQFNRWSIPSNIFISIALSPKLPISVTKLSICWKFHLIPFRNNCCSRLSHSENSICSNGCQLKCQCRADWWRCSRNTGISPISKRWNWCPREEINSKNQKICVDEGMEGKIVVITGFTNILCFIVELNSRTHIYTISLSPEFSHVLWVVVNCVVTATKNIFSLISLNFAIFAWTHMFSICFYFWWV